MFENLVPHLPILIIVIPLFGAFASYLFSKVSDKARDVFAFIVLGVTEFLVLVLGKDIYTNGLRVYTLGATSAELTAPTGYIMPVRIILEVDALSIFMGIITVTVAFIVFIFSLKPMKEYSGTDKYYTLMFLLLVGMLGIEFTGDLFNLFVFLEIASIAGAALVAFFTHRDESAEAAFKYVVICSLGALLVLFAVALFYGQYDALNIAYLANVMKYSLLDKIAFCVLLCAFAMKAGSAPMHMWKPDAYGEAPGPVAAILVTASLVSMYALLRVCFTLYGRGLNTEVIGWIITVLGLLSIFIGVTMALIQNNFGRLIGYTAVAEVGFILLAAGVGFAGFSSTGFGFTALQAGLFHILNDALDLGLLFLVSGAVLHATGKRNLNELSGLARNMKYTCIFFIVGLCAVAGLPPMNGFASKLMIYESVYQFNPVFSIIAILASIFMLAVFVKVFYSVFLGPELKEFSSVKEVPASMLLAMGALAVLIIVIGLCPDIFVNNVINPAARALIDYGIYRGVV